MTGDRRDTSADERDTASQRLDQTAALRDQAGDTRDKAAADRERTADLRDDAGDERDRAAAFRDVAAGSRDQAADSRDQAAAQRDLFADHSELSWIGDVASVALASQTARRQTTEDRKHALHDRRAATSERSHAQLDRDTALADRAEGARERSRAELDRESAAADRVASFRERMRAELDRDNALGDRAWSSAERAFAAFDGLTGVYLRPAGLVLLEQEIARARRSEHPLVVAFVDVDHLKLVNDTHGHAAGDALLLAVATALTNELRSYDVIIRFGGDEFVCALSDASMADAAARLAQVNQALAASSGGSVSFGLAELLPDESGHDVVGRADVDLYSKRELIRKRSSPAKPADQEAP